MTGQPNNENGLRLRTQAEANQRLEISMTNDTTLATLATLGGARVAAVLRFREHPVYGPVADILLAGYPLGDAIIRDYPTAELAITRTTADVAVELVAA